MSPWVHHHSAGGVVVKGSGDTAEVLLIKPAGRDRWQLPKGQIDPGETAESAAVREVREEGGIEAEVISKLPPIRFFYQMAGERIVKTVDFYVMAFVSGSPADHDHEVDDARWFPIDEAQARLTFASERETLAAALAATEVSR